jgi:Fe-S oxidoreductase
VDLQITCPFFWICGIEIKACSVRLIQKKILMKIQLFIPCYIDQLYPQTGFNTIKLLEKAGCEVRYNPNQTCCGQPALNS